MQQSFEMQESQLFTAVFRIMTFYRYLLFGIVPLLLSLAHASNVSASLSIPSLLPRLDPGTEIFYPSNANWSETIQRFNTYGEPTFSAALRPIDIEDVQTIVCLSASSNRLTLPPLIRPATKCFPGSVRGRA